MLIFRDFLQQMSKFAFIVAGLVLAIRKKGVN